MPCMHMHAGDGVAHDSLVLAASESRDPWHPSRKVAESFAMSASGAERLLLEPDGDGGVVLAPLATASLPTYAGLRDAPAQRASRVAP